MRSLALAAAVALVGCATAPQPKMSWAEAVGAEAPPPRPMLAMAGRQLPAALPRYVLRSSIVTVGGQAAVLNGYALCTFPVQNSSGTVEASIDCGGKVLSNAASGSDAFAVSTNGARWHIGTGVNEYIDATGGGTITFHGNVVGQTSFAADQFASRQTTNGPTIFSGAADGAGAVGTILDTFPNTFANAGAKLASVRNFGTERAYFDVNGMPFAGLTLKPIPADITNSAATAIQHGTGTCAANTLTVTFGTAFASGTPAVTCSATTATASACNANAISNTGFTAKCAGATDTFNYVAIGLR